MNRIAGLRYAHKLLHIAGAVNPKKMRFQAVMLMGVPAAGKSTYSIKKYLKYAEFTNIDPDAEKAAHPDYDPSNPAALHEWSKKVSEQKIKRAVAKGDPLVVDGTGTNTDKMLQKLRLLKKYGYRVTLVFVSTPKEISVERNQYPLIEYEDGDWYLTGDGRKHERVDILLIQNYLKSFPGIRKKIPSILEEVKEKGKWGRGRVVPSSIVNKKHDSIMDAFKRVRSKFDRVKVINGASGYASGSYKGKFARIMRIAKRIFTRS